MRGHAPSGTVRFFARRTDLLAGIGVGFQRPADAAHSSGDEQLDPVAPLGDVLPDALAHAFNSISRGQRPAVAVRAGEVKTAAQQPRPRDYAGVDRTAHLDIESVFLT